METDRRAALFARFERLSEIPMLALALVFLGLIFAVEILALSPALVAVVDGLIWIIWGVFAAELLIKLYLAPSRWRYLLESWPDVLTVALPFLRPLRALRLLVIVARVWRQTRSALRQRTLSLVGAASLATVLISAALVYAAEREVGGPIASYADALWWASATITTVGYGDVYPTTALGRGVAVFLMLTGITLFGLLTASIAAFFVEEDPPRPGAATLAEVLERLERIERLLAERER